MRLLVLRGVPAKSAKARIATEGHLLSAKCLTNSGHVCPADSHIRHEMGFCAERWLAAILWLDELTIPAAGSPVATLCQTSCSHVQQDHRTSCSRSTSCHLCQTSTSSRLFEGVKWSTESLLLLPPMLLSCTHHHWSGARWSKHLPNLKPCTRSNLGSILCFCSTAALHRQLLSCLQAACCSLASMMRTKIRLRSGGDHNRPGSGMQATALAGRCRLHARSCGFLQTLMALIRVPLTFGPASVSSVQLGASNHLQEASPSNVRCLQPGTPRKRQHLCPEHLGRGTPAAGALLPSYPGDK